MLNMQNVQPHWTPCTFTVYNYRSRGQKSINFQYNREHGVYTPSRATHKIRKIEWLWGLLGYGLLHNRLSCWWHIVPIRTFIMFVWKFFIVAWKLIPCQSNRCYNGIYIKKSRIKYAEYAEYAEYDQYVVLNMLTICRICRICRICIMTNMSNMQVPNSI